MTHPIPDAALTQHIAILGKTGSGKTYAAKGVVENILRDGGRVCVIDPTGAWHGLRSSATGKSAGFPVVIFGGAHADLPLGGAHGEAIAEIIGTATTPAIIDTSLMRVGERTRFFADFADALVRKNKGPLHLVIDEAHLFAPQGKVNDPQSGAMLHAANNLVSLGRSRGLRIILITQRPAKLHKDSLTQVETLVALRLVAPQDRRAVEDWIKDNADEKQGREIITSLAMLKTGQGWVWAPELGVLERVAFPKIKTFDTSKAPDEAESEDGPVLAPIDRDAIQKRLEVVAADAVANDPARLKAEITKLKREAAAMKPAVAVDPAAIEAADRAGYERGFTEGAQAAKNAILPKAEAVTAAATDLRHTVLPQPDYRPRPAPRPAPAATPRPARPVTNGHTQPAGATMPRAERRILTALAQYPGGRTKNQVAILTAYAVNGGGFNNAISALRTAGYLTGSGDRLDITDSGLEALGGFDPLPTGAALLDHWLGQLGKAEREALRVVADAWPDALTKEDIASQAGYAADGGGFNNALSRLRTLELVSGRGEIKASDELFE
jgi:Helicase HerA, central domain